MTNILHDIHTSLKTDRGPSWAGTTTKPAHNNMAGSEDEFTWDDVDKYDSEDSDDNEDSEGSENSEHREHCEHCEHCEHWERCPHC